MGKENRYKHKAFDIQIIFAFLLLLYPLRHAFVGIDMMDAGYALGNYRFFGVLNKTWKLATYLANVVGVLLSKLPFGGTWAGMNIYTGLLVGLTAACAYLFMVKQYGYRILMFVAEFVALSLCWAPYTVLYHYLGYIFMTIAVLVLYRAIITDSIRKYIIAGVILGLCVAVRMPNITYVAFILPVWYNCFLNRETFRVLFKRTGFCILGYMTGVVIPLGIICFCYGFDAYPAMVSELFGMTDTATDYKPVSMVMAMFEDYINYSAWLLLFLAYIVTGILFFYCFEKVRKGRKCEKLFQVGYVAGFFVLLRFCYGRGMFNFDYAEPFSMYKWVTVFLLIVIFFCIFLLLSKLERAENKLWAVFLLVIIFITPLGSNNKLYPIINNLFIVAPVFLYLLLDAVRMMQFGKNIGFVCKTVLYGILACVAAQSVMFGIIFVFHENLASAEYALALPMDSPVNGMKTNAFAKEELERLADYLLKYGLLERKLILYGDIPALSYILDMEPAIYTTWIDLDSNSAIRLEEELDAFTTKKSASLPVVVFGENAFHEGENGTDGIPLEQGQECMTKAGIINRFLLDNDYQEVYFGVSYRVYVAQ